MFLTDFFSENNIWYVSDYGPDDNDCQTESTPRQKIQTVLNRATDGAGICVTSHTLSLDIGNKFQCSNRYYGCCEVNSNISYSISSVHGTTINVTCSG